MPREALPNYEFLPIPVRLPVCCFLPGGEPENLGLLGRCILKPRE